MFKIVVGEADLARTQSEWLVTFRHLANAETVCCYLVNVLGFNKETTRVVEA